jgi:thermitase
MSNRLRVAIATPLLVALAACTTSPLRPASLPATDPTAAQATGMVLVKLRPDTSPEAVARLERTLGLANMTDPADVLGRIGWRRMRVLAGSVRATAAVASLAADPAVVKAERDTVFHLPRDERAVQGPSFQVNDPMAARQWAIARVNLARAHARTRSSARTIVAVLDTGVDGKHPDLLDGAGKSRVIPGRDFLKNIDDPLDGGGHGTHAAGIVGASADNGVGIVGMAPGCRILGEKVVSDYGFGTAASVAAGIVHAADAGASVISMSLGSPSCPDILKDAVAHAQAKGALLVAAMGNSGHHDILYPAAMPGVLAVGSTDEMDRKSSFSSFGEWISVSAPGSSILSLLPTNTNQTGFKDYGWMSGTSMATPCVAGLAALVRDLHPGLSAAAVKAHIERTAQPLGGSAFTPEFGHGRIDAARAVETLPRPS